MELEEIKKIATKFFELEFSKKYIFSEEEIEAFNIVTSNIKAEKKPKEELVNKLISAIKDCGEDIN